MFLKKFQMDKMISNQNSNEYFNTISHAVGTVFALIGTFVLVLPSWQSENWITFFSFLFYGISLILSMLFSTLLHFDLLRGQYHRIYGKLDHAAIYALIAGTITPFSLIIVKHQIGVWTFIAVWIMAAVFTLIKLKYFHRIPFWFSQLSYLLMGWVTTLLFYQMYKVIGLSGLLPIVIGGLFYTVGAVIFERERPDPWPPYFGSHEIWHCCVLIGNFSMFYAMFSIS